MQELIEFSEYVYVMNSWICNST